MQHVVVRRAPVVGSDSLSWPTVTRLCAAIVDRLTFAWQIIETDTVSYGSRAPARNAPSSRLPLNRAAERR